MNLLKLNVSVRAFTIAISFVRADESQRVFGQ